MYVSVSASINIRSLLIRCIFIGVANIIFLSEGNAVFLYADVPFRATVHAIYNWA